MRPLRLGAVSYLNALPLLEGLDGDPAVAELVRAVPSRLGELLADGELDCALAPVVLLTEIEGLELVDGPIIGCDGDVRTVLLWSRVPPEELDIVDADPASRTSNALCRLLLTELRQRAGRDGVVSVGANPGAPARVIIGDAAFTAPPAGTAYVVDLGRLWKDLTGLPFVFAGWLAAGPTVAARAASIVSAAAARGGASVSRLASDHALQHGCTPEVAMRYLRENISFDLDVGMRAGLQLFLDRVLSAEAQSSGESPARSSFVVE